MAAPRLSSFHLESVVVDIETLEDIARSFVQNVCKDMDAGSGQAFTNRCDVIIREGNLQLLVESFADSFVRVSASSIEDLRVRFSIMYSFVRHLPQNVLLEANIVPRIIEVVTALPARGAPRTPEALEDNQMRMEALHNLYTVVGANFPNRYETLVAMLTSGRSWGLYTPLDGTAASDVDELCNMWAQSADVALAQKRNIYRLLSDMSTEKVSRGVLEGTLSEEDRKQEELKHHRVLVKLLETYETSPELLGETVAYAARAAVFSIKYPLPGDMVASNKLEESEGLSANPALNSEASGSSDADWAGLTASASALGHFAAVKYLSSVPENKALYDLLEIFACKSLAEFSVFCQTNANFFAGSELDEERCRSNIRFLTLASLAANADSVSYTEIAEKLQVDISEVEKWVIDGVMCKVIDAKMDQLGKSVVINRGSQRLLADDQWLEVQAKLSAWKQSVRQLLGTVKAVHQEQAAMAQQPTN